MLNLKSFVPDGRVSTGLVAHYQGKLVWALSQEKYWRCQGTSHIASLIGIGGGQEPGESLPQAVARECVEEASTKVRLVGAKETLWVGTDGECKSQFLSQTHKDEPMPVLIWEKPVILKDDHGRSYDINYICAVYYGELLGVPRPSSETPGILLIPVSAFLTLLQGKRSLVSLLADGAVYFGTGIDQDLLLELHGSAQYIARHWSHVARQSPFTY